MKTLPFFVLATLVFLLVACGSQQISPMATNTAMLTPTHTITFTPTEIPTLTPIPTETLTITPNTPPSETPTHTHTFTPSSMPTPEAVKYNDLTIINNTDKPLSMKLESIDQPGRGYELIIPTRETKVFKIAAVTYSQMIWVCGLKSRSTFQMSGNSRFIFSPCK